MKRIYLIIIALLTSAIVSFAQKPKVASGEYTYYPPTTQSFEEARKVALYRAQMQILADTFGTVMSMSSTTLVENSSDNSSVNMFALNESSVKGEWLETIGEPEFTTSVTPDGVLAIKVSVTGKVREIVEAKADFIAKVLRNGLEEKFESTEFQEGDDMFVSFTSPANGYLTIYLFDGDSQVYCLLPYQQQQSTIIKVEGGKRYIFFSSENASYGVPDSMIDEYTLTCEKALEMNRMYIIWSPDNYYKAADSYESEDLPRILDIKSFNNWLSKLRVYNNKVAVKTIDIVIKKKK